MTGTRPNEIDDAMVSSVLAGDRSYDDVGEPEQTVIRAIWQERIEARRGSLDFVAEFRAAGLTWAECDAEGKTVYRS